jgi:hypothetical protein
MYNGEESESDSATQWPIKPIPPTGVCVIWKKYLGFMLTSKITLALRQTLEKWKEASPRTPWKYHEPSDLLYFQHSRGKT